MCRRHKIQLFRSSPSSIALSARLSSINRSVEYLPEPRPLNTAKASLGRGMILMMLPSTIHSTRESGSMFNRFLISEGMDTCPRAAVRLRQFLLPGAYGSIPGSGSAAQAPLRSIDETTAGDTWFPALPSVGVALLRCRPSGLRSNSTAATVGQPVSSTDQSQPLSPSAQ
jgi:hypothetical protein